MTVEKKPDVWIGAEWDALKEVIVGRAEQMAYPGMNDTFRKRLNNFNAAERENFIAQAGKSLKDVHEARFLKMYAEVEIWVKLSRYRWRNAM